MDLDKPLNLKKPIRMRENRINIRMPIGVAKEQQDMLSCILKDVAKSYARGN